LRAVRCEVNPSLASLGEALLEFLSEVRVGRFLCDPRLDRHAAVIHEREALGDYSTNGQLVVEFADGNRINGLIGFHFSQWDTDLFGKRMAIVRYFLVREHALYDHLDTARRLLASFHEWVMQNKIDVVIMRLDANIQTPILLVQQQGYHFFECANYLTLDDLATCRTESMDRSFRYAVAADLTRLQDLAAKHFFRRSHFFLDPRFQSSQAESLYAKWIESAFNDGQRIVVLEEGGRVCGMFLFAVSDFSSRLNRKYAIWKMAVLERGARGRGIGWRLFQNAVQACKELGVDAIDSSYVSQNVASSNIHSRLGFRLISASYTFHRWFS